MRITPPACGAHWPARIASGKLVVMNPFPPDRLRELARHHGTPLWVYDAPTIRARIAELSAFDTIRYAQKANSNIHLLRLMREQGVVVDAVSLGEIERALVKHVTDFLLELGAGFAFVGRQVRLEVGGDEFFLDLLFYHLKLRCYVVIELKAGDFQPEHLGKLGFYLTAVNAQLKHPQDGPTIGLLLCKTKNKVVAEYALRDKAQPLGVAEYQLVASLPPELQTSLPTIEQIERELTAGDKNFSEDQT